MDLTAILLIVSGVLVVLVISALLLLKKREVVKNIELDEIINLFKKENVISVEYIRNKIVVKFVDVKKFDVNKLHEKGALGVNIIGDKIKFYFDGNNEKNASIYNDIKSYIER